MNTLTAFMLGEANRGKEMMVFDWDKAAQLILEHGATEAHAGLRDDWEYTGGCIFRNGHPVKNSYTYLASTWATPEIDIDGTVMDCYRMESKTPGWDEKTKWPDSALAILQGKIIDGEKVEG